MKIKANIMDEAAVDRAIIRISHEIVERNDGAEGVYLVGIKSRGVPLAYRIAKNINDAYGVNVPVAQLDTSKFRDDVSVKDRRFANLPFDVNGAKVVLVDDVLFTGRTTRAAIEGIIAEGRPQCIELAVLVDRGHRELPIRADFVGKNLPTSKSEFVDVRLEECDGVSSVTVVDKN